MYSIALLVVGLLALGAVVVPLLLSRRRLMNYPVLVLVAGLAVRWALPDVSFDPVRHVKVVEHLSEFVVIVALTGLGLSIDRPISRRGWQTTWRLLGITMPLTIVAAALLGWWLIGLAPAAALLFGAVMAPTDPVLANDVQTGPPSTDPRHLGEPDEVRFGLTSESALNDGLAFPFTNLALLVAVSGWDPQQLGTEWLVVDVAYRIAGGVAIGWLLGQALGRVTLWIAGRSAPTPEGVLPGLLTLAFTLTSYGLGELLHTYGFIAVFVTAAVIRQVERDHDVHRHLHVGVQQLELLGMSVVVLLLGAALADGLWREITPMMAVTAVLLVLVIRPLAGWTGLLGCRGLSRPETAAIAFFGIRGLGSVFYLAHGLVEHDFADAKQLWALTAATIVASLVVHGLSARPAMQALDRRRPPDRVDDLLTAG